MATISNSLDDLDKASYNIRSKDTRDTLARAFSFSTLAVLSFLIYLIYSGLVFKSRLVQFFVITIINISMNCKNFHGNVEGENYSQTLTNFSKFFLYSW